MGDKENGQYSSLNDHNTRGSWVNTQIPSSLLPAVLHRLGLPREQAHVEPSFDEAKADLKSDDWEVRVAAVRTLEKLDTASSVSLIASALEDQDESVRAAAVHALGNIEKQPTTYWLIVALHDADWHVRETAVLALGKQKVPREVFMTALHDTDESVREAATLALQWHAAEDRSSASYGKLWEQKPMQSEKHDTISLNGKDSQEQLETVPYDGIMVERRDAESAHNSRDQVQVYAPQEYASFEYGDGMLSRGEKLTPSSRWPKKAWWAIVAASIFFFLLGSAATGLLVPLQVSFTQPASKSVQAVPSQNFRYTKIVLVDIASALHLDPQQITAQLQAGKSMTDIASGQGVSSSELQNLELKAFADAYNEAAKAGDISQQQANEGIQQLQDNPQLLDKLTTSLFLTGFGPPLPLPAGPGGN